MSSKNERIGKREFNAFPAKSTVESINSKNWTAEKDFNAHKSSLPEFTDEIVSKDMWYGLLHHRTNK